MGKHFRFCSGDLNCIFKKSSFQSLEIETIILLIHTYFVHIMDFPQVDLLLPSDIEICQVNYVFHCILNKLTSTPNITRYRIVNCSHRYLLKILEIY